MQERSVMFLLSLTQEFKDTSILVCLAVINNLFQIGIPNGEQPNQLVKKNLMVEILH